ncbi:MAG TPA: DMT family transporter [Xanthobacteraceae bacterium]|nr:DMT family transporter [Xanthobacteraceae bacterium]
MSPEKRSALIGYLALVATVLLWSAWIVYTRQGVQHALPISVIAFLRMLVPALVLAPLIWRAGIFGRGHPLALFFCVLGAGLPHIFIAATGLRYASAADFSAVVMGSMPIFVAILSALLFKESFGWLRTVGLISTVAGVLAIAQNGLFSSNADVNFGHILFLVVALNYAGYTIGFRQSGLTPFEATGLVAFWSLLFILPFGLMPTIEYVRNGHAGEIAFQAVLQGVLSNLIGLVTFSEGVRRLGASRSAAFTALVPVVATLMAIPVLGEWPDGWAITGVIFASIGVVLASGVLALSERTDRTAAG